MLNQIIQTLKNISGYISLIYIQKLVKKNKSMFLEFKTVVKIPEVKHHLPMLPGAVLFPEQKKMREMTHYV